MSFDIDALNWIVDPHLMRRATNVLGSPSFPNVLNDATAIVIALAQENVADWH